MPSDKSRITQQAKLTYSPLGKAFDKQTIEDQGMKQVEVLKLEENNENIKSVEGIFTKGMRTNEIKNEIDGIRKCEEKLKKKRFKTWNKKRHIWFSAKWNNKIFWWKYLSWQN